MRSHRLPLPFAAVFASAAVAASGFAGPDGPSLTRDPGACGGGSPFTCSADGSCMARNDGQGLCVRADRTGIGVGPCPPGAGRAGELVLSLAGIGRRNDVRRVGCAQLTVAGSRAELRRPGIVEWYVNRECGIEQGFTIDGPLVAGDPASPLLVEVLLLGEFSVRLSEAADALVFVRPTGETFLRYGASQAWDATGRPLQTELSPAGDRFRIEVDDAGAVYPVIIDPLMTRPLWRGAGEQKWEYYGFSVGGGGDVNGDGYDDLLVGAYAHWAPGQVSTKQGRVYLHLGGPEGPSPTADWIFPGEGSNDELGRSVAMAGDVNGDGFDDILVGAPMWGSPGAVEGKVYLFHGSSEGPGDTPDWTARSLQPATQTAASWFGNSVAGAGDVNGDGFDDVIIGAMSYESAPPAQEGLVLVFYGSAVGLGADGTPGNADWVATGDASGPIGGNVAGAGDVDGDGYDDIIIGSPGYEDDTFTQMSEGWLFVFYGSKRGLGRPGTPQNADWTAQSNRSRGTLGSEVASAGDVNGDGYDDIIAGAIYYSNGDTDEGAAFLWLGSHQGLGPDGTPANADWFVEGEENEARMESVCRAGDLNSDGYDDVLVGAASADHPFGRGAGYVWFGGPPGGANGPSGLGPSGSPSSAEWVFYGDEAADRLGGSVTGAGDVNADGFGDVALGAVFADDEADIETGRAYVFPGTCGNEDADRDGLSPSSDPLCGPDDIVDCDDTDGDVWSAPGEVENVAFLSDTVTLSWSAPQDPGGTGASSPFYDTLRSEDPADFDLAGVCVESDDDLDTVATDIEIPLARRAFHYLVRAENPCPTGQGSLGAGTGGGERTGRPCP